MMTFSPFRQPVKDKSIGSDASDIEETDDDLGLLPQFNKSAGGGIPTAPPEDSEYGLSIPMSVSSMSFSASTAATTPSQIDPPTLSPSRLAAFNRRLSDDGASLIVTRSGELEDIDEFSEYLSRYSTYTDFTTNPTTTNVTAGTNLTQTTSANSDDNSGLFNEGTFSVVTGYTTVPTSFPSNTATSVTTKTTATEFNADPTLSTQLVPSDQAKSEGSEKESVFACFTDMPWLQFLTFASPVEKKGDENTAEKAIVGVSQSKPIASPFLSSEKMGREDILRMAIATSLNFLAESKDGDSENRDIAGCVKNFYMDMAGSTAAAGTSSPYQPDGANASLVVRKACTDALCQPPAPAHSPEDTPAPGIAPDMSLGTAEDKSRSSRSSDRSSKDSNGGSMFARTRSLFKKHPKATPATEAEVKNESTTKEDDARDESICEFNTVNDDSSMHELNTIRSKDLRPGFPINSNVAGCVNFYSDMLLGSKDFASGVLLELEMNGVFPVAAEKFDALDEDSQLRFVNSHIRQLISRMSSGREKQVAFYHAFLHLVSASTLNAVEEISTYDFARSCSATKESTEMVALAAKKAIAKIIEADIMDELENDEHEEISALRSVFTDDNLSQFGIEMPYEQCQALQKSKFPFHFDFSKYVRSVKKARAHLSTRRAMVATGKDHEHAAERERSSTDEEKAPTVFNQKKIADIIEAKPTNDTCISYDDDTAFRRLLEAESEERHVKEQNSTGEREGGELFFIPDCTKLASMVTTAAAVIKKQDDNEAASTGEREGGEMFSIPDCTKLTSMMTAAVAIKNANEHESATICERSESDHNSASKCQAKEEGEEKKEKSLANEEAETKKPREKEAEDISMRVLKEHVKRKRKIEQARKKAIQELLQQSRLHRLQSAKAPNARYSNGRKTNKKINTGKNTSRSTKVPLSKGRRDQGGAIQNLPSNKRSSSTGQAKIRPSSSSASSRSSSSRTRTGAQRNYRQVSTGLNKTSRLVKSSE